MAESAWHTVLAEPGPFGAKEIAVLPVTSPDVRVWVVVHARPGEVGMVENCDTTAATGKGLNRLPNF